MSNVIVKIKDGIKSIVAAFTLVAIVYVGAVAFLTAVLLDKVLLLINSRYTVEMLIEKVDARIEAFISGYKNWISQYDIDPSKIKFFK